MTRKPLGFLCEAYTCYRYTAVAVIPVNRVLSLLNMVRVARGTDIFEFIKSSVLYSPHMSIKLFAFLTCQNSNKQRNFLPNKLEKGDPRTTVKIR